jgi:hypothetical protein
MVMSARSVDVSRLSINIITVFQLNDVGEQVKPLKPGGNAGPPLGTLRNRVDLPEVLSWGEPTNDPKSWYLPPPLRYLLFSK